MLDHYDNDDDDADDRDDVNRLFEINAFDLMKW